MERAGSAAPKGSTTSCWKACASPRKHRIGRIILGTRHGLHRAELRGLGHRRRVPRLHHHSGSPKWARGEITVEAYRSAYQNELRRLQQRARRAITNEEARRYGLDQQVLQRLITELSLDQKARALGLAIERRDRCEARARGECLQGPDRQVRLRPLQADFPRRRLYGAQLPRRAEGRLSAQGAHRFVVAGRGAAAARARGAASFPQRDARRRLFPAAGRRPPARPPTPPKRS